MGGVLVVVGSVKGSPGCTTLALGLAACWPTGERLTAPLVVEADPGGGDVAARFGLSESPGLVSLAAAARRPASPQVLGECVQILPGGLHVVVGPAGAQQAAAAVGLFAGQGAGLLRAGMGTSGSVLLDVGRLLPETAGLVAAADRLLLVTRGEAEALAHASGKVEEYRAAGRGVELVVVGPSPYPSSEISSVLGVEQVHRMPWEEKTARVWCGRGTVPARRWRNSPLVHAVTTMACHLTPGAVTRQPGGDPVQNGAVPASEVSMDGQPLAEAGERG
jgi:hypothetical protein